MKIRTIGIALSIGTLAACAAKHAEKPAPPPPPQAAAPAAPVAGTVGEESVTATATVRAVSMKTRHVTLERADGKRFTVVAGPEVRNLAQVKKGDVLRITYRESIAYQVNKPGKTMPGTATSTDVSRAPLGAKPAGSVTNTVTVRATITAIDKTKSEVSLKNADGKVTVVKVKDPTKLDQVAVGDVVDITYTEALALAVEKAGHK